MPDDGRPVSHSADLAAKAAEGQFNKFKALRLVLG
jgi:hypothetical protein